MKQIIPANGWWMVYTNEDGTRFKEKIVAIGIKENGDVVFLEIGGFDEHVWIEEVGVAANRACICYEGDERLIGL